MADMTTIYGECVSGPQREQVTISQLAAGGCRLRGASLAALDGGDLALWIGAVGPLAITAARDGTRDFAARFKQPLDPAIIAHFTA